ncbi:hypothetical protein WMY93_006072 [Mugilogobius chulae]|uniref:Uncharacterized protein n=1 Tax=Mugilogobius chulae TaxID=88201 RepID=A0AAW0PIT1_9GOBI
MASTEMNSWLQIKGGLRLDRPGHHHKEGVRGWPWSRRRTWSWRRAGPADGSTTQHPHPHPSLVRTKDRERERGHWLKCAAACFLLCVLQSAVDELKKNKTGKPILDPSWNRGAAEADPKQRKRNFMEEEVRTSVLSQKTSPPAPKCATEENRCWKMKIGGLSQYQRRMEEEKGSHPMDSGCQYEQKRDQALEAVMQLIGQEEFSSQDEEEKRAPDVEKPQKIRVAVWRRCQRRK